jgi:predicted DNA-binding protein (MmcQ/YjbR family)
MAPNPTLVRHEAALREAALAYPEAYEEFPWGHRALKVKTKVFVFLYLGDDGLSLSAKLPQSSEVALLLPYASPTGYGLGKSGWVTARFAPDAEVPVELLRGWIDESYRAVAPKKLAARVAGATAEAEPTPKPATRPARTRAPTRSAGAKPAGAKPKPARAATTPRTATPVRAAKPATRAAAKPAKARARRSTAA